MRPIEEIMKDQETERLQEQGKQNRKGYTLAFSFVALSILVIWLFFR